MRAAQILKSDGCFAGLASLTPYAEINEFLAAGIRSRQERESTTDAFHSPSKEVRP
jgi:hypothetical protein